MSAYNRNVRSSLPVVTEDFLTRGSKKRPGIALSEVLSIVVHYTATAKVDPFALQRFWKRTESDTYSSAHLLVGDTAIVQCIPYNEIGYHVGALTYKRLGRKLIEHSKQSTPNYSTIGIEMCQETADVGSVLISEKTRMNTISLVVDLLVKFGLSVDDVSTHGQITGKHCPAIAFEHGFYGGHFGEGIEPVMSMWWTDFIGSCESCFLA